MALRAVASSGSGGSVGGTAGLVPLTVPSILFVGDSTVSQNCTVSEQATAITSTAATYYGRAIGWIDRITGGALNLEATLDPVDNTRKGNLAGVGGANMLDVITRLSTGDIFTGFAPLLNRSEKYFWVQIGTNDINGGDSLATLITHMTTIISSILAVGKIPILTTVLPRNGVDGATDWSNTAGGTTTAQKRLTLQSFNNWLEDYAKEKNLICISWHRAFSATNGDAITGYTVEGVHPNDKGAYFLAMEALRQLNGQLPISVKGQKSTYDAYDATYNPYGNILNGDFSGSGGVTSDAGGTGTITGTVPDNFQLRKNTSTTTSVASSVVTRNGMQALKLDFTVTGGGSSSEEFRLNYWNGSGSTSLASFAIYDDVMSMSCGFEVESNTLGGVVSTQVRTGMNSTVTVTASTISFNTADNSINDSANGFGLFKNLRAINVSGSGTNDRVFKVVTATAGKLLISSDTPVTAQSAGASITVTLPINQVLTNSSSEKFPDANTDVFWERTPTWIVPFSGNCTPRVTIYVDGTKTGTFTVYIYAPTLRKRQFKPAVLSIVADDDF